MFAGSQVHLAFNYLKRAVPGSQHTVTEAKRLKRPGRETKTKEITRPLYPVFPSICSGIFQVLVPSPLNFVPLGCSMVCIMQCNGECATCYHCNCCAITSYCNI